MKIASLLALATLAAGASAASTKSCSNFDNVKIRAAPNTKSSTKVLGLLQKNKCVPCAGGNCELVAGGSYDGCGVTGGTSWTKVTYTLPSGKATGYIAYMCQHWK
ncbi:uncharacterized protein EV422DRAFT_534474 [Fimicolochytrium jonesii]|uniref:uncharacterized protein n=1 Tax=Fimicolochytrium jonesii TaxID=1396493 RepID=UPI0022FE9E56|nr:uncharacterized protein EV422DRAFT_534474 [Fimicolochytrium jonesii]KAI8819366.1 hypothetical protein EV422DRAFT_534474 [Fimicolochytrium jonesii]